MDVLTSDFEWPHGHLKIQIDIHECPIINTIKRSLFLFQNVAIAFPLSIRNVKFEFSWRSAKKEVWGEMYVLVTNIFATDQAAYGGNQTCVMAADLWAPNEPDYPAGGSCLAMNSSVASLRLVQCSQALKAVCFQDLATGTWLSWYIWLTPVYVCEHRIEDIVHIWNM